MGLGSARAGQQNRINGKVTAWMPGRGLITRQFPLTHLTVLSLQCYILIPLTSSSLLASQHRWHCEQGHDIQKSIDRSPWKRKQPTRACSLTAKPPAWVGKHPSRTVCPAPLRRSGKEAQLNTYRTKQQVFDPRLLHWSKLKGTTWCYD